MCTVKDFGTWPSFSFLRQTLETSENFRKNAKKFNRPSHQELFTVDSDNIILITLVMIHNGIKMVSYDPVSKCHFISISGSCPTSPRWRPPLFS